MPKILLTGASGRLATHLRARFAVQGRAVLATDIVTASDSAAIEIADLADRAAVDRLMGQDISAVVHFGGMSTEAAWQTVLDANIVGTYNVFEAARQAGVGRVIYASTYHVQGFYPLDAAPVGVDDPYRPDTLYGVSKVFGEALSRLYFDKFGIECLAIRICTAGNPGTPREARLWCNRDDLGALVERGLDVAALGHRTVFGTSNNPNVYFLNTPDPDLGWTPQHSSLELGQPDPRQPLDPADPRHRYLGGVFANWGHFDDR
jgi:uronate dehydrogenase